jgi:metallo-beta-lactamase family protein
MDRSRLVTSITFLGAAGTVTGSRFLLEAAGRRLLVDAGMFQGPRELRAHNWARFPVEPASLDTIVITHAHLDHVGFLPVLVREGFAGPVFLTRRTADLAAIVLADSARLHEEDASHASRHGYSKHHPPLPLYTARDAARAIERFRPVGFETTIDVAEGITAVLRPAGHILGAATAVVDAGGVTIGFTGDLGRPSHPLLRPPARRVETDVVVTESTYGNRRHEDASAAFERMAEAIRRTAARGGTVVIPSFAVDRTEVVLLALRKLRGEGRIPDLPVHVDSPMALSVLDVYRAAVANGDPDVRPGIHLELLDAIGDVHEAHTPLESKALNTLPYPAIIISASGMATGGRVLHHLAARLPNRRDTVLLVGFQAAGTRGRSLADGAQTVRMHGQDVPVRAEVVSIDAFSVHADGDELIDWLEPGRPPAQTFVVHGEPEASTALATRIGDELGWPVDVPAFGERVDLPACASERPATKG